MPRKPTAAELREENTRQRDEISTLAMALTLAVGTDPDAAEAFSVGEAGERERYTLKLYGATRADGGTVVQVRTWRGCKLPEVNAYRLDDLREHATRNAALLCSDFNVSRRDALDRLVIVRNDLAAARYAPCTEDSPYARAEAGAADSRGE